MRARIVTSLIGGPLLLAALVAGGPWWAGFVAIVTVLAQVEWRFLLQKYASVSIPWETLMVGGLYAVVAAYLYTEGSGPVPGAFGWAAGLFGLALYTMGREAFTGGKPLLSTGAALLGIVYGAGMPAHLVLLRGLSPDGLALTLLAVVGTWVTDSGAFFIGRAVGGRRLVPALSPGKTVAGAIGGWVSGFVAVALAGVFLAALPLGRSVLLAAVIPVAAQLGDLLESGLKREANVKDTGKLLPGHGGVLDRFDSLLLVVPVVYYLSALF